MPVTRVQRALAALALAAGTSTEEALIARGFDPACAAGDDAARAARRPPAACSPKDEGRYGADDQYTQGWDEGFAKCRRDMAAMVLDARLRNPSKDN